MSEASPELFISKGLLPENLPPIFNSKNLWKHLDQDTNNYSITQKCVGDHSPYIASKRGGQRRLFMLTHPSFVLDQAKFISSHWSQIDSNFSNQTLSASKPELLSDITRHVRVTPHSDLPSIRLSRLSRYKFALLADVSRFYPSIYTHSIPWALHRKKASKSDKKVESISIIGNRLDFILRQAQSGQTIGIAVGPDTSKIIAELIMSAVDTEFISLSKRQKPEFIRHVDDYWIGATSYEDAQAKLNNLQMALREYQLDTNELKTSVISMRHVFGDSWPSEFEKEIIGNSKGINSIAVLGKIVDKASANNDEGIIKHTIRVIDKNQLWSDNWKIYEHFLFQCVLQFPHAFDYVARVIAWRNRLGGLLDKSKWVDIASSFALEGSSVGRDSDVVWAIWLIKELSGKIRKQLSEAIIKHNNPVVVGLLAHCYANKLTTDKDLVAKMQNLVEGDFFSGKSWPLTLELVHLGIMALPHHFSQPEAMTCLHRPKTSLIDWGAQPSVFSAHDSVGHDDEPDHAIEDYAQEYGGDEIPEDEDESEIDISDF